MGICNFQFLLLLIFSVAAANAATAAKWDLTANNGQELIVDGSFSFSFNVTILQRILEKFQYLSIYLSRSDQLQNNLVRFLLEQRIYTLRILIGNNARRHTIDGDFQRYTLRFYIPSRNIAVSMTSDELETGKLDRFASRDGFILCMIFGNVNSSKLNNYARRLWIDYRIYRVYYITHNSIWFYNPFESSNLNADGSLGGLVDASNNSMKRIFSNMNGYTVRMYTFKSVFSSLKGNSVTKTITEVSGADSEAAILLSKKMNFTIEFQWPDDKYFGARLANGSYNGAIGRIIRSETDIVVSGFFVKDYLTRDITFTVSVYMDELCCYVRKAQRIPPSILPLFAVNIDIWIGFFMVGLISPLMWMLMRYINLLFKKSSSSSKPSDTTKQYVRIFSDTWVIWVRNSINCYPKFYSERIFVISLCLVSVIYGALFESSLATVYIHPLYYKDINTLRELDETGYRIYFKHGAMKDDLFYGHSSEIYKNLNRKLLFVDEDELKDRLISTMSKRGGFAAVTRAAALKLYDIRYFITKKVHIIPECPKNYHIAFVLSHLSPFEEPFNIQLLFFVEAGLFQNWIDVMKHKAKTKIHTYPDYYNVDNGEQDFWKVLTLKDLQLAFYALTFGCTLALLSLIGEWSYAFQSKRIKKSRKIMRIHIVP